MRKKQGVTIIERAEIVVPAFAKIVYNIIQLISETSVDIICSLTGVDIKQCPKCREGQMYTIMEIPKVRSPSVEMKVLINTAFA